MYYTENNHNKVVLRDFYLSRFENGPITEPCGTPEYLGRIQSIPLRFTICHPLIPLFIIFTFCGEYRPGTDQVYFTLLSFLLSCAFEDDNLSVVNS